MKAYVLHGIDDLRYEEIDRPAVKDGWALVKVKAAGICSSDVPRIFKTGTYHFPTVPGHEFCGEVTAVGSESDAALVGRRVGVFPLIPCKKCESCKQGKYETCKNYDYLGSRRDGGFAEYVACPVWNLIELPDAVSYTQAAVLEPLAVARHALNAANLTKVKTAAIIGTGAIGLFMAMILTSEGKEVALVGRSEGKRSLATRCGIGDYIVGDDGRKFDLTVEAVGSSASLAQSIELAKPGGQVVLVGNPAEDTMAMEKAIYWQILRRQLCVYGTWNSSYEKDAPSDWSAVLRLIAEKKVDPEKAVTHVLSQERLPEGLDMMKNKTAVYGRIVVKFNE